MTEHFPIWWAACKCYVWPLAVGATGRCGRCGEAATTPVTAPKSGKALPLAAYERENR